ncbi:MAG: helix-turn-helix transcriptional regulator [Myxococcales bacterium]|nr:helix-turn-helix transcriptional regulator [Myxococcales bacterium]
MVTPTRLAAVCRARDRLRELGPSAPSVRALATDAGLTTTGFIRIFAAVFGETPHQYRIRSRLEHAKRLLAEGELSVTEICFSLGFSSLGSFSHQFGQRVGVSPSAYRRRLRRQLGTPGVPPRALTPGCLELMAVALGGPGTSPG